MSYTILGRRIANEWLALGTFATVGTLAVYSTSGGSKAPANAKPEPPVTGSSKEEEDFIKNFIAEAEKEEKATAGGGH